MSLQVHFCEDVEVFYLPESEQRDAWLARHGPWVCAPKHDELWDGDLRDFRPKELTKSEFKRLKLDQKIKKVMPSSVFYLYQKTRKKIPEKNRGKGFGGDNDDEDDEVEGKRHSETVPKDFIAAYLESPEKYQKKVGLRSAMKGRNDAESSSSKRSSKRFSLGRFRREEEEEKRESRRGSPFDWGFLRRNSDDTDEGDMSEALPFLERIQKLDGLSNTKVQRSSAVESVWDNLVDNWGKISLLGQSYVWDAQAFLHELWPGNPLDPVPV